MLGRKPTTAATNISAVAPTDTSVVLYTFSASSSALLAKRKNVVSIP